MIIALILRNSLLWVFCPRFLVTAQMVYQVAYGILLSVPTNFLPPHTISIHHYKVNCCHSRVTLHAKSVQIWTHMLKQFINLERIIYMPDNLSGGGVITTQHLWNGDCQFQFVLVEPRHALQKGNLLHSQVYCISPYTDDWWPANTARPKAWQCLFIVISALHFWKRDCFNTCFTVGWLIKWFFNRLPDGNCDILKRSAILPLFRR